MEKITIAAVAERAEISVGSIYRRFEGKEQLVSALTVRILDRRRAAVAERLHEAEPSLPGVVNAYAHALMESFADSHKVFPDLLALREADADDHGARTIDGIRDLLREAAAPHLDAVRRSEPDTALDIVASAVLGACFHGFLRPDTLIPHMGKSEYADALSDMATAYLITPDQTG